MGVTNRNKIIYKPSVASSTAGSSTESLHLPSEAGSYHPEEPEQGLSFRRALTLLTRDNVTRVTPLGRRRANRLKSLRDLENLGTINEEDEGDTVATYVASGNRPFLRIINDDRLSKAWHHFCMCSEMEQDNILNSKLYSVRNGKTIGIKNKRENWNKDKNGCNVRLAVEAYKSLTYLTRRRLRKVKNLQPLSFMEQVILDNFYINRKDLVENMELEKHMQFICCAACQYYNLNLKLQYSEDGSVSCTIEGMDDCYTHCLEKLSSFLKLRRTGRTGKMLQ